MLKYTKTKNRENYLTEKLANKSESSRNIFNTAINSLDNTCTTEYNVSNFDKIIQDVLKMDAEQREDEITSVLQQWVNKLAKTMVFNTIKIEFSAINKYLKYYKIRCDFSENIEFPQNIQEERYAVSIDEIQKILDSARPKQKCYYLCLISSGCRPVEVLGLRKRDFFWTGKRYGARIPATLTKKKISRTVFFSIECTFFLRRMLEKITDDDQTIFTKNPILKNARTSEDRILKRHLEGLGMDYKFETTGYSKINLYCFRGYFFTKSIRIFNEDIAHAMVGHGAYLQQYQRRNESEKEELYEELESHLLVFDQTKNKEKIRKLKEANTVVADQAEQLKQQEVRIKQLERQWFESKHPGIKNL